MCHANNSIKINVRNEKLIVLCQLLSRKAKYCIVCAGFEITSNADIFVPYDFLRALEVKDGSTLRLNFGKKCGVAPVVMVRKDSSTVRYVSNFC